MKILPFAAGALLLCGANGVRAQDPATIEWFHGPFAAALAKAKSLDKPLFLYFWMDGSQHCVDLFHKTLQTPAGAAALAGFVCVSADATTEDGAELVQRFGVATLPTMLVIDGDGRADDAILGFIPAAGLATEIKRIRDGVQTVSALRAAAAAAPNDLDQRFAYAQKLAFVGDQKGSDALQASIRAADPDGRTAAGAELIMFDLRQQILDAAADPTDLRTWDLTPLYRRLPQIAHGASLFKGWDWLARTEQERGNRDKERDAYRAAWPHIPAARLEEWGAELLNQLWNQREELDAAEKKFAMTVAQAVARAADAALAQTAASASGDEYRQKRAAMAFAAAARGLALGGRRSKALAAAGRCAVLDPANEEYSHLQDQLRQ